MVTSSQRRVAVGAAVAGACLIIASVVSVLLLRPGEAAPAPAAAPAMQEQRQEAALAKAEAPARAESKDAPAAEERGDRGAPPPIVVERLGARRTSCAGVCALEAQCGFRSVPDCTAQSCEGDLRKLSRADFAMAKAADCAAAAATPCEEACWKRGECTGHHDNDRQCTKTCRTLVKQLPEESYRENRCVIERPCAELPLCAERG